MGMGLRSLTTPGTVISVSSAHHHEEAKVSQPSLSPAPEIWPRPAAYVLGTIMAILGSSGVLAIFASPTPGALYLALFAGLIGILATIASWCAEPILRRKRNIRMDRLVHSIHLCGLVMYGSVLWHAISHLSA